MELTASNTYTGATTVSGSICGSILRLSNIGALPTGSNLTLDGGVVELAAGDFTRSLGSGPGQVQFTANGGGFAAVGANRVVNLGGSSAHVDLGQRQFPAQRRAADARHGRRPIRRSIFKTRSIWAVASQTVQVNCRLRRPWMPSSRVSSAAAAG